MEQITELEEEVKALSSTHTAFVPDFQAINQDIIIPQRLNNLSSGGRSEEPAGAADKRADWS